MIVFLEHCEIYSIAQDLDNSQNEVMSNIYTAISWGKHRKLVYPTNLHNGMKWQSLAEEIELPILT